VGRRHHGKRLTLPSSAVVWFFVWARGVGANPTRDVIVIPRQAARLWLVSVIDYFNGNGPGDNPLLMLHLYRNDIAPVATTVLADFLECTFNGYAPRAIAGLFPFPATNPEGQAESASGNVMFVAADQAVNETCHGWYITLQSDTVPAVLFACERIVPAVQMQLPAASVCVNVRLQLGSRFN